MSHHYIFVLLQFIKITKIKNKKHHKRLVLRRSKTFIVKHGLGNKLSLKTYLVTNRKTNNKPYKTQETFDLIGIEE